MPLSIKNADVDRLARELARETGETMTEAIRRALEERLRRLRGRRGLPSLAQEVHAIQARVVQLEVLDDRPPDVMLGYDDAGLPG